MPILSRHSVALGSPGDTHANTIVLGGATLVVPIEMDPDTDPLHDDEVRLWSARGSYDRTLLVSDPDVEPDLDARMMHYRFDDVPLGVYRVEVCVGGQWHGLMHDLVVAKDGVFLGGKKFATEKPDLKALPSDGFDGADPPGEDGLDAPEPVQTSFNQSMAAEDDGD